MKLLSTDDWLARHPKVMAVCAVLLFLLVTYLEEIPKGNIMEPNYLQAVRQRVALNDAERYIAYAKQDLKNGKPVSAAVYTNAAIRKLQSII